MSATTFKNQHQFSRLQSNQCAERWDGGSFQIFFYSISYVIYLDLKEIFPDLHDLSGSHKIFPISPVLIKSLLISPDLCGPYLIFARRTSPESFPNIAEYFRIFRYHSGSPDDRAWDKKV
jgi:hypothetical protein